MSGEIPTGGLRFEPGYTFSLQPGLDEFSQDNVLIGGLRKSDSVQAFFLGRMAEYQLMKKNVWVDYEGAHAIYVIGKRRSGKTYTLGILAEGLAAQSWVRQGTTPQAVLLLDTMNIFLTMHHDIWSVFDKNSKQVEELGKWGLVQDKLPVVLYYPKGTSPPPEGISEEVALRPCDLTGEDWASLFEVDTYADPIGQLISEIYDKVAIEGYDLDDGTHVAKNSNYGLTELQACLDRAVGIQAPRYEQRTIEAVRRRLSAVMRLDIFSNQGMDIKKLFNPGKISVLLLRDVEHSVRALLVGVLVKKIMQMRNMSDKYERLAAVQLSRIGNKDNLVASKDAKAKFDEYTQEAGKGLPRGWIIIDEAHNYMPSRGIVASSEPLKKYVNEGRNLGLSIVVATQNPSGLDPSIRRNADVLILHSISMKDDVSAAEGMVNTFVPDSFELGKIKVENRVFEQMLRSLPQGYAVVSNDRSNRVIVVKVRPRLTVHGGIEY